MALLRGRKMACLAWTSKTGNYRGEGGGGIELGQNIIILDVDVDVDVDVGNCS